jgi:hypothetical protein
VRNSSASQLRRALRALTPFEAECEAERRWSGWAAKAFYDGQYVVLVKPIAGQRAASSGFSEIVARSPSGFLEAIDALGVPR